MRKNEGWQQKKLENSKGHPIDFYWERTDGAYVHHDSSCPTDSRCWLAFGTDGRYLSKSTNRTKFRIPRRWNTPEAAMRALDREMPLS